ncbi:PREDICTED: coiled-coil domain-containing protein 113-like [Papilio polytes]|uniref:coiled-coil domain-containing protein 113-like n=1 Tax=Papilio polytes TaxID=76194 RepID=UPI000675EAA7|nr:PREDICTED: coiled-coil domain-containing protein 113-like [Papilio polytes]
MSTSQSHVNRNFPSRSISQITNEIEEITDEELVKQVNELKHQIKVLTLENEVFERTMARLDPTLLHGIQQALEYATRLNSNSSLNVGSFVRSQTSRLFFESLTSPSKMFASPSKISTKRAESSARVGGTVMFGTGPKINVLERSEIVSAEMEILMANLELMRQKAAKQHALLKAQLEELELRVEHIQNFREEFYKEVVIEGWDKIAQRIPAEIWVRYMNEWVKITDRKIGKFRLRTSTLNTQYSKLKGQIKIKAELSEHLRPVDFEKIKIENNECLSIIDKKLQQLAELKKMTGDANLTLSIHKKALMEQNIYLNEVLSNVKRKQKQTISLNKETEIIENQAKGLEVKLDDIKKLRNAYEVPDVMDYVHVKAEIADLKLSVKLLQNRLRILQIALSSHHRRLNKLSLES